MPDPTTRFLVFIAFSATALSLGYAARVRGWLYEAASRSIHFVTVVGVWSIAAVFSLWRLPRDPSIVWLLVIQPLLVALTAYGVIPLARRFGCSPRQVGVVAVGAGLSNNGFTLGSYLCYALLHPPEQALAYGIAIVMSMMAWTVPLIYPMARRFGSNNDQSSVARLIVSSFLDIRALPLYAATTGATLAFTGVPFPDAVDRLHVIDVLFYLGALGGYLGIGLRLRLGDSLRFIKQHALLAVVKFAVAPAAVFVMLSAVAASPWPLDPLAASVVQIQATMPTAIVMVMIANLFNLDARMASNLWVCNTVLFVLIPLPVIVWVTMG